MPYYDDDIDDYGKLMSSRNKWLDEIIEYNEKLYGQQIIDTEEDEESYWLYFEEKKQESMNMITKSIDEPEKIDYEKWAVEKIQYIKPEAVNKKEPIEDSKGLTITVNETTYDYKFTYFYGWSNNYYQQDSKYRTAFSYILNVLISFTPIKNVTCQWLIGEVAGTYYNLIDETKPATAKTYNKYYYRNKVCSIKPVGATTWYPTCQIGERRTFAWGYTSCQLESGELYIKTQAQKMGSGNPPTNFDSIERKSHFLDDTWMANKAIETMNIGGYVDVYAVVTNTY